MSSVNSAASMDQKTLVECFLGLGRYESVQVIGSGGMADVLRVKDRELDVLRAIKVLKPDLMKHQQVVDRFRSEARAMTKIQHPSIVQVYDSLSMKQGEDVLFYYIVLEWCSGGTLEDHINCTGGMPSRQAVETVLFLCQGLRLAHKQSIFHRDIKPDNVLITEEGVAKLADFGIARIDIPGAARNTVTNMGMGSLGYMPPEQFKNAAQANAASDIHALGMTLWHMITGERPHPEPSWYNEFQEDDTLMHRVPPGLIPVLRKATRYKNEERYQTLDEFMTELNHALFHLPQDPEGVLELGSVRPVKEGLITGIESTVDPSHSEEPLKVGTLHEGNGQVSKVSFTQLPKAYRRSFVPVLTIGGFVLLAGVFLVLFLKPDKTVDDSTSQATSAEQTVMAVAQPEPLGSVSEVLLKKDVPIIHSDVGVQASASTPASEALKPKSPNIPSSVKPVGEHRPPATASKAVAGTIIRPTPPSEAPPPVVSQDVRVSVNLPEGDGAEIWIEGSFGKRRLPTSVPAGTYKITAQFDGREFMTVIPNLTVSDTPVLLKCKSAFALCKH